MHKRHLRPEDYLKSNDGLLVMSSAMLIEQYRAPQHRAVVQAILLANRAVGLDDRQRIE